MRYFLFLLLTAMLVACTAEVSQETPSPVAIMIETLPPAGDTPTATATLPPTDSPTETATLPPTDNPTETATLLPTLTPTPLPAPAGRILFFWDPKLPHEMGPYNPEPNLYLVTPDGDVTHWNIQILLGSLYGHINNALSPDQTKIALQVLDDKNGDGYISSEGAKRGLDAPNLFVYDLTNGNYQQLTTDFPAIGTPQWLLDNQTVLYRKDKSLWTVNIATQVTTELVGPFPEEVSNFVWDPSGRLLAIDLQPYSSQLYIFDDQTKELVVVSGSEAGYPSNLGWSPDSQWLFSTLSFDVGLSVVNLPSLEIQQLLSDEVYAQFSWSSDSQWTALVQNSRSDLGRPINGSLFIGDTESRLPRLVFQSTYISEAIWSDENTVFTAGSLLEQEGSLSGGSLLLVDPSTNTVNILWQQEVDEPMEYGAVKPVMWSPDGRWLLFYSQVYGTRYTNSGLETSSGLYLIDKDGGPVYQILDTSNTRIPYGFAWLP